MNPIVACTFLAAGLVALAVSSSTTPANAAESTGPALNFRVKDIDGKNVDLKKYQGKVILFVNVASKCGNTPQYAGLEKLYEKYKEQGFVILGFPANEFGHQEPGSDSEIKQFCTGKYSVSFPMFSKIIVKGEGQAPLYKYLTEKTGKDIEWNFAKILVNRKGEVVTRFGNREQPDSAPVVSAIEKELAEK